LTAAKKHYWRRFFFPVCGVYALLWAIVLFRYFPTDDVVGRTRSIEGLADAYATSHARASRPVLAVAGQTISCRVSLFGANLQSCPTHFFEKQVRVVGFDSDALFPRRIFVASEIYVENRLIWKRQREDDFSRALADIVGVLVLSGILFFSVYPRENR
jgi:hypothetical protein